MIYEVETRSRGVKKMRLFIILLGFAIQAFIVGFIWFVYSTNNIPADSGKHADAIVVLTGSKGRLEEGLRLYMAGRAQKLFVSGVNPKVTAMELWRNHKDFIAANACCIVLGYEAFNTQDNARETAGWVRREGYSSIILVTSDYHMKRGLLEFNQQMPKVEITPHIVETADFTMYARMFLVEYIKYLIKLANLPI